jgi:hypothetical protein
MQIQVQFFEGEIKDCALPHVHKGGIYEFPLEALTDSPDIERLQKGKVGIGRWIEPATYEVVCRIIRSNDGYLLADCGIIFKIDYYGPRTTLTEGELLKCPLRFSADGFLYYTHELKRPDCVPAIYRWRVDKIERLDMVNDETGMEIAIPYEIDHTNQDYDDENIDILTLTLLDAEPQKERSIKSLLSEQAINYLSN